MLLSDIVRHHAKHRPDHPALRWPDGEWTWAELDRRSNRAAQALRTAGVAPGDRVAYLDKNAPEFVELVYGTAKLGAVFTPLNFRLTADELGPIVADAQPTAWVVGAEFAETAGRVADTLDYSLPLTVVGSGDGEGYAERVDAAADDDPRHAQEPGDVVLLLYSSGTTGEPKGIELTNANIESCVYRFDEVMGLGAPDAVCLAPLPLFHVGGSTWALAAHRVGTTVTIMRDPVPASILDILEQQRITHAGFVPALMRALLNVDGVRERDYSALRGVLYGASPIPEALLRDLVPVLACKFFQVYGSTETTAAVVLLPSEDHDPDGPNAHRLRSCGVPVDTAEVRVVDPVTGTDVTDGETGEFWIRSPSVMRGYFGRPDLTAEALTDGWFHSGDVGYRDPDGYLYLRDRTKDVIVSGAENVYPAEVENALAGHPAVADCAVIGVPSERWGETPKAVVVLRPGADDVTAEQLLEQCRTRLAGYKCPSSVDFVDELPRNATGKVMKKDLRAPYWEGHERRLG